MSDGVGEGGGAGDGGNGGSGEGELDPTGAAGGGAEGGQGAGDGGEGGKAGGEAAPWYGALSDEAADAYSLSDLAWLKNKGFADPAAMVKSYRGLEAKVTAKGFDVPGEDASPEQLAAFRKAIGVPDAADGYKLDIPEGWEEEVGVMSAVREAALQAGTPAGAFDAIAKAYTAQVLDDYNRRVAVHDGEKDAVIGEWGAQKDQNLALYQRGMEAFGFDADKVKAMQVAMGEGGTRFMMDLGLKLGRLSGEDGFISGGRKSFGISAADARNELQQLETDKGFIAKLSAKDPAATARHERLLAVISADDEAKAAAARAA